MLTQEEIQVKSDELSRVHNCKVHPLVFKNPLDENDQIVGYVKEPQFEVKTRIADKFDQPISSTAAILDSYLIKEESDARIYDRDLVMKDDQYRMGACVILYDSVKYSINQFKKK